MLFVFASLKSLSLIPVCYICYHDNILWSYLWRLVFVESVMIIGTCLCLDELMSVTANIHPLAPSFPSYLEQHRFIATYFLNRICSRLVYVRTQWVRNSSGAWRVKILFSIFDIGAMPILNGVLVYFSILSISSICKI